MAPLARQNPAEPKSQDWKTGIKATCRLIRAHPWDLIAPLIVLVLVLGCGLVAVVYVAHADASNHKDRAHSLAVGAAAWYEQRVAQAIGPVKVMVALVEWDPRFQSAAALFKGLVPALMAQTPDGAIKRLTLAPSGVIHTVFPRDGTNELAEGLDLLNGTVSGVPQEEVGLVALVAARALAVNGPYQTLATEVGIRVNAPIFLRTNSTQSPAASAAGDEWGRPDPVNPYCGEACALNANSGLKFWGLVGAVIELTALVSGPDSPLRALEALGYRYMLEAPRAPPQSRVIAATATPPSHPVDAVIELPGSQWVLHVSPAEGWSPAWLGGLVSMVVVVALVMFVLVLAVLVSRRKHQLLLRALLPKQLLQEMSTCQTVMTDLAARGPVRTDTPADVMLDMLAALLEGGAPDVRDVVFVRSALIKSLDLYHPLDLSGQLKAANLDTDVMRALMKQLGATRSSDREGDAGELTDAGGDDEGGMRERSISITATGRKSAAQQPRLRAGRKVTQWPLKPTMEGGSCGGGGGARGADDLQGLEGAALEEVLLGGTCQDEDSGEEEEQEEQEEEEQDPCIKTLAGGLALVLARQTQTRPLPPPQQQQLSPEPLLSLLLPARGPARLPSARVDSGANVVTGAAAAEGGPAGDAVSPRDSSRGSAAAAAACSPKPFQKSTLTSRLAMLYRTSSAVSSGGGSGGGRSGGGGASSGAGVGSAREHAMSAGTHGQLLLSAPVRLALMSTMSTNDTMSADDLNAVAAAALSVDTFVHAEELDGGQEAGARVAAVVAAALGSTCASSGGRRWRSRGGSQVSPAPPPPIIEEVERVLAGVDGLQFDTWRLAEVTQGHALSALGFYLLQREGLLDFFHLQPAKLARLLRAVEAGYLDNPYHSATHAADVLQTLHVIIHGAQLHVHYLDRLGLLAAYWAAIVHDHAHPGLTNDFLIASSDSLAVRYNDRSPLENHHAASAFALLHTPGADLNAFENLTPQEAASFRKQVIEMVLSTDMKQHFAIVSHFNTVHRLAAYTAGSAPGRGAPYLAQQAQRRSSGAADASAGVVAGNASAAIPMHPGVVGADSPTAPRPVDDTEKLLTLQIALKVADIGHLGEELPVHCKWLAGLEEEFFRQGDKEKELGLPISPLFDRAKQGVSKSQVGFYDFVALPLVHAMASAFPGVQPITNLFLCNYNHWRRVEGKPSIDATRTALPEASASGASAGTADAAAVAVSVAPLSPPPPPLPPGVSTSRAGSTRPSHDAVASLHASVRPSSQRGGSARESQEQPRLAPLLPPGVSRIAATLRPYSMDLAGAKR